jgi:hypothetical protein
MSPRISVEEAVGMGIAPPREHWQVVNIVWFSRENGQVIIRTKEYDNNLISGIRCPSIG